MYVFAWFVTDHDFITELSMRGFSWIKGLRGGWDAACRSHFVTNTRNRGNVSDLFYK